MHGSGGQSPRLRGFEKTAQGSYALDRIRAFGRQFFLRPAESSLAAHHIDSPSQPKLYTDETPWRYGKHGNQRDQAPLCSKIVVILIKQYAAAIPFRTALDKPNSVIALAQRLVGKSVAVGNINYSAAANG